MLWTKPFVESVRHLVPLHKITDITGYKVPLANFELGDGSCGTSTYRKYGIFIRTHHHVVARLGKPRTFLTHRYTRATPYFILQTLAHELAHTIVWEHTAGHWQSELKIAKIFAKKARVMRIGDMSLLASYRRIPNGRI